MGAFVPCVDNDKLNKCETLQCDDEKMCLGAATSQWPVMVIHGALLPVIYSNKEQCSYKY